MKADAISPDLEAVLRRLKLSPHPRHPARAARPRAPAEDAAPGLAAPDPAGRGRRAATARPPTLRAQRGHLDPSAQLENWDDTAKVTFDRALLNELVSLRFLEAHHHVPIVGPVGVGKTFLAHALGHIACRRGHSVLAAAADKTLKTLHHARLTNSYEAELRKLIAVDLLILDDFGLDAMDAAGEPRRLRDPHRAPPRRLRHRHLEPRPRRVARHLRRSAPRPERHRPLHQQRLRPRHRGRVLPAPAQTHIPEVRTASLDSAVRGLWKLPVLWKTANGRGFPQGPCTPANGRRRAQLPQASASGSQRTTATKGELALTFGSA